MLGYPKTISTRMIRNKIYWEVIKCYALKDGKLELVKWGIKKWVESPEMFVFYDSWNDILDYMSEN